MEEVQDLRDQYGRIDEADSDPQTALAGITGRQENAPESKPNPSRPAEMIPPGKLFEITVSDDAMEARLTFKRITQDSDVAIQAVKQRLKESGIIFGVIDEKIIARHISTDSLPNQPFRIAQGILPTPGRSATVVYHFDTQPLKVGTISESGAIDYRDRGVIPQVKKGDLLAERSPGIKGAPGIDIFGRPVPPPDYEDIRIVGGKGVEKSVDGFKFHARIDGRPELTPEGTLCVFPDLHIHGDVNLATGHIEFEGNVEVRGSVCEGFRVKAKSLRAEEVCHAQVNLDGDLVVAGGIIGAQVEVGGTVKAGHVQTSTVTAAKIIEVEHDVYESTMEASGKILVRHGKILRSNLTAKEGIEALEIGSPTAKPSSLTVGIDSKIKQEISELSEQMTETGKDLDHLQKIVAGLKQKYRNVDLEYSEAFQEEDLASKQKRSLEEKLRTFGHSVNSTRKVEVTTIINQLNAQITKLHRQVERLQEEKQNIRTMIENLEKEISESAANLEQMNLRYEALLPNSDAGQTDATLTVSGAIYAQTQITGPHTATVLTGTHQNVIIREAHDPDVQENGWSIEVVPRT